jgi:trimeric autotransporter adhesin
MFGSRGSRNTRLDQKRLRLEALESRVVMSATGLADAGPIPLQPVVQTPATLLTGEEWVHSLTFPYFNLIPANQIQFLTLQQVASIPNTSYFQQWSPESRAALSAPQVQALNVAAVGVKLLTPQQVGALTSAQIQSAPAWELQFLLPSQVPALTSTQISALTRSFFAEWTPQGRAALTAPQVRWLDMADVALAQLTSVQRTYLTAGQIQSVPVWELELLSASQVPYLSATQVSGLTTPFLNTWSPEMRAALTASQIPALNIEQVSSRSAWRCSAPRRSAR